MMKTKIFLILLFISSYTFAQTWNQVGAAQFTNAAADVALALDNSGIPYVVYTDTTDDKVHVEKFDGTNWVNIGTNVSPNTQPTHLAIAINPISGQPWVSYMSSANRQVIKRFDATNWVLETSDVFGVKPVSKVQLKFDTNGDVTIASAKDYSLSPQYKDDILIKRKDNGQTSWTTGFTSIIKNKSFDLITANKIAYCHIPSSGVLYKRIIKEYATGSWSNIYLQSASNDIGIMASESNKVIYDNSAGGARTLIGENGISSPPNNTNTKQGIQQLIHNPINNKEYAFYIQSNDALRVLEYTNTWTDISPSLTMQANCSAKIELNQTGSELYIAYMDNDKVSVKKYSISLCEPVNVQVNNIAQTTADLSWDAPVTSTTNWEIALVPAAQPLSSGTFFSSSTNSFSLSGMNPGTPYDVYVRALCGGSLSDWTIPVSFVTMSPPIFVDLNATAGTLDGTSWADAYTNLQEAIDGATSGQQIWVAQGTYHPTTTDANPRKARYRINKILKIYGGFQGNETQVSQRNAVANVTILSGDLNDNDNTNIISGEATRSENAYHVVILGGDFFAGTIVDGFTITGGNANGSTNHVNGSAGYDDKTGAAIYANPTGASRRVSAEFVNCIIEKNTAEKHAVMSTYSPSGATGTLTKVDFTSVIIRDNTSVKSIIAYSASAQYNNLRYGNVINCLISDNENTSANYVAVIYAGSIGATSSSAACEVNIINSTIANNTSASGYMLKFLQIDVASKIDNSIIYNNGGASLLNISSSLLTSNNSIIEGGHLGASNVDPKFKNIGSRDYSLDSTSPAIDTGDNSFLSATITKDVAGNNRIENSTIDMGALEYFTVVSYYDLTVSKIGNGTVTPAVGVHNYADGTVVTLTASPATGWVFDKWSGDIISVSSSESITIDANKSVTAEFKQIQHTLTVNVVGSGTVTRSDPPVNGTYVYGAGVTLTAVPAAGWQFDGWSGASNQVTLSTVIIMDADKTVTATFSQIQYELTIVENTGTVVPNSGTLSGGVYTYNSGTAVDITAVANSGYVFNHYEITDSSGTISNTSNPLSITMNDNTTVEAFYTATYTLTTSVTGSGSVSPNGTTTHSDGDIVSVTATPIVGWSFDGWSGASSSVAATINVTLDANKTLVATFSQIQYELTLTATNGSVLPDSGTLVGGVYTYNSGTGVIITPTGDTGYSFVKFDITDSSGVITSSTSNPLSITMIDHMVVEAVFSATASVGNNTLASLKIYPNPVKDVLRIDLDDALSIIEIYNTLGQRVLTSQTKEINVLNLDKGTYLIRINTLSKKTITKLFIKK